MSQILVEIKKLDRRLQEQRYAMMYSTPGSAAIDLRACIARAIMLKPGESAMIHTGVAVHIKRPDYVGIVAARSGLACRHGITLSNGIGVIDSDYTGQIVVGLRNLGTETFGIGPMDRIAQFMVMPVTRMAMLEVTEFDRTVRGEGGFGSTGVK